MISGQDDIETHVVDLLSTSEYYLCVEENISGMQLRLAQGCLELLNLQDRF